MGAEAEYLKLLRRPDLPAAEVERILRDSDARRYHAVRLALAGHRNTPRGDAISLVETLFWRALAHLSTDTRVHPEVRRAADTQLLRRLPELALSERIDLARSTGRGTLPALRQDPDPRVVAGFLDNRLTTEPDVVFVAGAARSRPETLAAIAEHPRWATRRGVREALLKNRSLPLAAVEPLLARAAERELRALADGPGEPPALRAVAQRVLARRARAD
ncbi:MAG TPA: hypothetical protein VGA31_05710 [Thermoanaerobaculia bacterium]